MTIWQRISGAATASLSKDAVVAFLRRLGMASDSTNPPTQGVAFTIAMVALSAKMAKSDGVVTSDEIAAFRRVCAFPDSEMENVRHVFDLARQDVAGYEYYARQINRLLSAEPLLRRNVLEGLFVIAAADGILHEREEAYLKSVAELLSIPPAEYNWVRSLFVATQTNPYEVLGLAPDAAPETIRRQYRKLVLEHHPDKLMGRGVPPEFVAIAERKMAAINSAYDVIARERAL